MQDELRAEDTVARLGGDEFVILLKELGEQSTIAANQAQRIAEKIQQTISKPFCIEQHELYITLSIGISLFAKDNSDAAKIINQADTAMYRAKEAGRNTLRFYRASMQGVADARLAMEKDLRKALIDKNLSLHYQPQMDVNNVIIGAEALLRWHHPIRGMVSPREFIPLAEETGMILQIWEMVLLNACKQLKKWESLYQTSPFHLAINVSPHQFRMPDFVSHIQRVIEQTGINPNCLMLEVTEGVLIDNINDTVKKMHALKKLGVRFSIDDFGTGYSSLTYLKSLPLDQLKIDQSFVRDINRDANDEAIVETIITMTRILGIDVIAEGVETESQVHFLQKKGCNKFQGYYFGKPVPAEKFTSTLKKNPFSRLVNAFLAR
jgi:predicted signal transduction protein with EAL and GGDEF domain